MIRISNLRKQYGNTLAVDLPKAELGSENLHALVGPNGSGKTTLLRLICGLEQPTSGGIELDVPAASVAFCLQKPFAFAGTVRTNVEFGLRAKRMKDPVAVAQDWMDALGILHLAERNAKRLSAGELQRLSLARSLAPNPDLLLLDEPLANIDAESSEIIESMILERSHNGKTVVMATHSLDRAYHFTGTVLRLEEGRLAPPELRNVFSAAIRREHDRTRADLGNGISFEVVTSRSGKVRLAVSPHDIILSRQPLASSMRNSFPGRITGLFDRKDHVEVAADIGHPLRVHITHSSFRKMGLTLTSRVTLSFKATAVKVF